MLIIENIFYLSIVYIVFNFIWGLMVQLPKMMLTGMKSNITFDHTIKAIRYLLISTLTYSTCNDYIFNHSLSNQMVIMVYLSGGLILSLYLAGKLNKKQNIFKLATSVTANLKFGKKNLMQQQLTYESHIVGVSIVVFAACVGIPIVGEIMSRNPLNIWFLNTIDGLYKAPILKWIIGLAGIIFMLSMFQRAINTVQRIISKLKGEKPEENNDNPLNKMMNEFEKMNNSNNPFENKKEKVELDDDIYVDFEEMEEDQENEKK